ncbi:hypothetical protein FHW88_005232 [Mucilaginibacter sp. SG538B]|nr:hypothetical protein [Mucilaginibacter sp. SG538B]
MTTEHYNDQAIFLYNTITMQPAIRITPEQWNHIIKSPGSVETLFQYTSAAQ